MAKFLQPGSFRIIRGETLFSMIKSGGLLRMLTRRNDLYAWKKEEESLLRD